MILKNVWYYYIVSTALHIRVILLFCTIFSQIIILGILILITPKLLVNLDTSIFSKNYLFHNIQIKNVFSISIKKCELPQFTPFKM